VRNKDDAETLERTDKKEADDEDQKEQAKQRGGAKRVGAEAGSGVQEDAETGDVKEALDTAAEKHLAGLGAAEKHLARMGARATAVGGDEVRIGCLARLCRCECEALTVRLKHCRGGAKNVRKRNSSSSRHSVNRRRTDWQQRSRSRRRCELDVFRAL
jgi:hypothetical protein